MPQNVPDGNENEHNEGHQITHVSTTTLGHHRVDPSKCAAQETSSVKHLPFHAAYQIVLTSHLVKEGRASQRYTHTSTTTASNRVLNGIQRKHSDCGHGLCSAGRLKDTTTLEASGGWQNISWTSHIASPVSHYMFKGENLGKYSWEDQVVFYRGSIEYRTPMNHNGQPQLVFYFIRVPGTF